MMKRRSTRHPYELSFCLILEMGATRYKKLEVSRPEGVTRKWIKCAQGNGSRFAIHLTQGKHVDFILIEHMHADTFNFKQLNFIWEKGTWLLRPGNTQTLVLC